MQINIKSEESVSKVEKRVSAEIAIIQKSIFLKISSFRSAGFNPL